MERVKFKKTEQRKFLKKVLIELNCPYLKELINRGFEINYSTLKNYFSESRLLPQNLFEELCYASKINPKKLKIKYLKNNWGQIKGGKN